MRALRILLTALIANGAALAAGPGKDAIPLFFIANRGQAPRPVQFMATASGLTAYFLRDEVLLRTAGASVHVRFEGASALAVEGAEPLPAKANFLTGRSSQWRLQVPTFREVVYRDLYPGVDMVYRGSGHELKSEFVVAPGADPTGIRVRYENAGALWIEGDGALVIPVAGLNLRERAPLIYQERDGSRCAVEGRFELAGDGAVGFVLGAYDATRPLIIDPVLSYSTLLGGSGFDTAAAIAVDSAGAAYVAGYTDSYNVPTANPEQNFNAGGNDVFVAKLNPAGNGLAYCTYIGGSGDDRAYGITVDSSGSAYVTGSTTSTNFPTRNAVQSKLQGWRNAFVLKLNPAGNLLAFSTYLGGNGSDNGNGIALDSAGNAYVVGDTTSVNFPATAFQKGFHGVQDVFVTKISPDGSRLLYGTFLGGANVDRGTAIAVDSGGSAYITGSTYSSDFPTMNAFQRNIAGGGDAFITRLSADGNSLVFSTYLGGSGGTVSYPETGQGIALDSQGNAYVVGVTSSSDFPLLQALQPSRLGATDAFVTKVNSAGALVYSTYLGGSSIDVGNAIAVDQSGAAYVVGYTYSTDLPVATGALQATNAGDCDAFVAKLTPAGNSLAYLSYLGGSGSDTATALTLDLNGNVYVAGWTLSTNFPLLNPFQSTNAGNYGAFVTKLGFAQLPSVLGVTPNSGSGASQTFSFQYSDPNGASNLTTVSALFNSSLTAVSGCAVTYNRVQNTLSLLTDAGVPPSGSITPGSGTQQNSQCTLNGSGSSVSISGTVLTLNLALTFQGSFGGAKNIYLQAANPAGTANWQQEGTWTVALPALVSALSCNPTSVASNATASCTVTLNQAATTGLSVTVSSNNTLLTVPASVTVAAGSSTATFNATAGVIPSSQSATVTASLSGTSKSVQFTLVPPALPPTLNISKTHVGNFTQGQASATYTVTVSNASGAASTSGAVTVTETVPSGLTLVSMAGTGWTCPSGGNTCTRSTGLAGGASYPSITVTVNVSATATSPQVNAVSVSGGGSASANTTDSTVITAQTQSSTVRVHACGAQYTDSAGSVWSADYGYLNGSCNPTSASISGTSDPTLYQAERYSTTGSLTYQFAVANGTYNVTLKFAELYYTSAGQRVFNVAINGAPVTTNLDIFAAAPGADRAYDVTYPVAVTGGQVSIVLTGVTGYPKVNALQIAPAAAGTPLLSISKSHTGSFAQGQAGASYAVTVSNAGTGSTSGAVTVTETVPSGLTLVSMAGTGWNCPSGGNTCTRSDGLAGGASYPLITVTVNVSATATSPQVNAVSVSGGGSASANTTDATVINTPVQSATDRVHACGAQYTDAAGNVWSADYGYLNGSCNLTSASISGTSDPTLYQAERYSTTGSLTYQFAVTNGSYNVTLKFAELDYTSAGQRVFDVAVNGTTVDSHLDIFAAAGAAFKAYDVNFPVVVSGGQISIALNSIVGYPKVDAIAITPLSSPDFLLTATPYALSAAAGAGSAYQVTVTPAAGFNGTVNLSVSGLPAGASASPAAISAGGTIGLAVSIGPGTPLGTYPLTITGNSGSVSHAYNVQLSVTAATATVLRVRSCGAAYMDTTGNTWQADYGYTGGNCNVTTNSISGTTDPTLYQAERYSTTGSLSYQFAVANGAHIVTLKFAELYYGAAAQRVFNVAINGTPVALNLDIIALAGEAFRAYDLVCPVTVTGGLVTVTLTAVTGYPKIDAIEIQ